VALARAVLFCAGFGNSAAMLMPAPDSNTIAQKARLAAALARLLPPESVIADPIALKAYESDALTAYRQAPLLVTLPRNTAEVAAVLKFCAANKVKVVPRGAGIIPAGMEMMDRPAIHAAEDFVHADYPLDAEALLIVELDGPSVECDHLLQQVTEIVKANGATSLRVSESEAERLKIWAGRKAAFPAVGRISPDYICMDGTIPRRRLSEVLTRMAALSKQYGLRVANVFHAGDGNLHPLILFDANKGELESAEKFGADILRLCVEVGGVLTGEHGVGVEKRDLMPEMFTELDLDQQIRLKIAFDPDQLLNPGKVFPNLHRCAELGRMHVRGGALPHPELPRF
jgi:glycolate oxidase